MTEEIYLKETIKKLVNNCDDKDLLYLIYSLLGNYKKDGQ